jgi:5'-nucleotidase
MSQLEILHFNDVYRVTPQKVSGGTMDVTQFLALVDSLRTEEFKKKGLFLFSGDVFSPSVESTVTRGSHMVSKRAASFDVPDMKVPGPSYKRDSSRCCSDWCDAFLTVIVLSNLKLIHLGNHDFDFGYPHLSNLVQDCKFVRLMSVAL